LRSYNPQKGRKVCQGIQLLILTAPSGSHTVRGVVQHRTNLQLALSDLVEGVSSVHIWSALGWQEVMQRYRRSVLGPFWLTISTALMVGIMGPLYGKLFNQDVGTYFAHLAVSLVLWQTISQIMLDSSIAFIVSDVYIKQVRLPLTIHILRTLWKNLVILFHNFAVVVIVIIFFRPPLGLALLLFPLALVIFAANALWVGILLGMVCARFRDIPLVVTNVMQVAFFLTPILWKPEMLGRHAWSVNFNPFFHFLEIMRAPLLGTPTNALSWAVVATITFAGYALTIAFYSRFRARIAYWI